MNITERRPTFIVENPLLEAFLAPISDEERTWYREVFKRDADDEPNYLRSLGLPPPRLPTLISVQRRRELARKYAWAIPDDRAILALARYAPIVEIGAGTGYWASLLRAVGASIIAYDENPPSLASAANHWHPGAQQWTTVLRGDALSAHAHFERTLMLCWPPYDSPMAHDALCSYGGNRVVYIGEWGGCTADDAFHEELEKHWTEVLSIDIPHWETVHDSMMVFERVQ